MDELLRHSLLERGKHNNCMTGDPGELNKKNEPTEKSSFPECAICGDKSTGKHYKVFSCEGCKNFFRRSIRNKCRYKCPAFGTCPVERDQRTRCKACRMKKCIEVGMKKEAVQCERKPLVLLKQRPTPELTTSGSVSSPESDSHSVDGKDAGKTSPTKSNASATDAVTSNTETSSTAPSPTAEASRRMPLVNKATSTDDDRNMAGLVFDELLCSSIPFHVDQPAIAMTDLGYLYEVATRLLFATVDWARGLVAFNCLCEQDRMRLVVEKWGSLFAIGVAQCAEMFPLSTLLALTTSERESDRKFYNPLLRWHTFQKLKTLVLNGVVIAKYDKKIYEHVKIVTLFDNALSGLLEVGGIAETRRRAQVILEETLSNQLTSQHSDVRERIIAVLESAHDLSTQEITEAFFSPIVKETSVEFILGASLLGVKGIERCMANPAAQE